MDYLPKTQAGSSLTLAAQEIFDEDGFIMPILEIEVVVTEDESLGHELAPSLAEAAGGIFGSPAGGTWVRLRELPLSQYAENGGGPIDGVLPVFVTVLKARLPTPGDLESEIEKLTNEIARLCKRPPENVHLIYQPEGAGRVAFGGRLVTG